jgi:hypothetical protein
MAEVIDTNKQQPKRMLANVSAGEAKETRSD